MNLDNVNKPFIWRKKYEELGVQIDEKQIEEEHRKRAEANKAELEKIKERQRKRELEYQQRLNESEFLQRQKEAEQHEHWEQQEDSFILRQHRQRSKIRIRDGRAKPIDLFSHYIDIFGFKLDDQHEGKGYVQEEKIDLSDSPVELLNPCEWFNGLRISDLESLEPDIEIYMKADCEENQQYWEDILDVVRNELSKLQALKATEDSAGSDINSAVLNDIMQLFNDKSIRELDDMETEMEYKLRDDDPSIDVSFYKSALLRLRGHRATLRLTNNHKKNLMRQKQKILQRKDDDEQVIEKDSADVEIKTDCDTENKEVPTTSNSVRHMRTDENSDVNEKSENLGNDDNDDDDADEENDDAPTDRYEDLRKRCIEDYKRGNYEPKMCALSEIDIARVVLVDFEQEFELLCQQRRQIANATSLDEAKMATMSREERDFMSAAQKGMVPEEESTFSCEAPVRGKDNRVQTYIWADKYQPRKPRYFNRVHTGFEWNKYNQTHYDIDNPPPKVVQGYKFNIFYPDLIDKSKAPTFSLTPCKDDKDFCIIRFTAGPPYEDIAFKIVNREWNNSHKSGFRCQFMNNMLQLWFQFKRYRYRR